MDSTEDKKPQKHFPSKVTFLGHPIHPILVDFPIAFLSAALLTDLIYWRTGTPLWANFSFWLLLAGFVSGILAAAIGLIDFLTIKKVRDTRSGWIHFLSNDAALILTFFNLVPRLSNREGLILFTGLALSALAAALLTIGGFYGGELVFGFRIGVFERESDQSAE